MVGITLSAEQIRAAPPEVRHWIEQQVAATFAPQAAAEEAHSAPPHLAAITAGEAQAILEQVEDLLPVVSVYFELGRESASVPVQGMRAFRLGDMLRHTRLDRTEQVIEALELLNDALRRVRRDPEAVLCAFDREGRCYVSEATSHAVLTLWRGIVAEHALGGQQTAPAGETAPAAYRSPGYKLSVPGVASSVAQPIMPVEQSD